MKLTIKQLIINNIVCLRRIIRNNYSLLLIWSFLIVNFLSITLSLPSYASLDPMTIGGGARSLAMGRTSTAQTGDLNSMFINPANAAYLENWGLTSMYSSLLDGDISYTLLGGGKEFPWGTLGLAYLSAGSSGITVATRDANSRLVSSGNTFDYSNSVISLVWGKRWHKLGLGLNLKSFSKSFSNQTGGSASGHDLDIGLVFKPNKKISLGLTRQNMLSSGLNWETNTNEDIATKTKLGFCLKPKNNLSLAADLDLEDNKPLLVHGGLEWLLKPGLPLRIGFEQVATSKTNSTINYTAGLGLNFANFTFDYAYYIDTILANNSTHYFTLSFIPQNKEQEISKTIGQSQKQVQTKSIFKDVPNNYWARQAIEALAQGKVISGYPDNTFKPEKSLSRAEVCALLVRAKNAKLNMTTKQIFKDVKVHHWYEIYVATAYKYGLVDGYLDQTFKPNQSLSREEAIKILALSDKLKILEAKNKLFEDLPLSRWSANYIAAAAKAGWLDYISGKKFYPKKKFTRAEAAYILYKTDFVKKALN